MLMLIIIIFFNNSVVNMHVVLFMGIITKTKIQMLIWYCYGSLLFHMFILEISKYRIPFWQGSI